MFVNTADTVPKQILTVWGNHYRLFFNSGQSIKEDAAQPTTSHGSLYETKNFPATSTSAALGTTNTTLPCVTPLSAQKKKKNIHVYSNSH